MIRDRIQPTLFPDASRPEQIGVHVGARPRASKMASADPTAAEDDVAVVENSGLARGDGALRGVERHARDGGVERLDCGGGRGVRLGGCFGSGERGGGGVLAESNL